MKYLILIAALSLFCGSCGDTGSTGPAGPIGEAGPQGPKGEDGKDGKDSNPIVTVSLCPGDQPSYPSSFPEYGVCIDNQLYAVYSVNGGFFALIPPGTYQSNAVGSHCTFKVLENCQVERLN